MEPSESLTLAAKLIQQADGILITAGAGMGVDSGLPDFRGKEGFWRAYPVLQHLNLSFSDIATPSTFEDSPELAWGFYGHRLQLYRDTVPHEGFYILQELAANKTHGAFVFTSNVDGQFQKAGFDESRIVECHGSIHQLQCSDPCQEEIISADPIEVDIDTDQCLWRSALPRCSHCGKVMRPNIMMFNDYGWLSHRTDRQNIRLKNWLSQVETLIVIELGAGKAISTVRNLGERMQEPLIRINPRDFNVRNSRSIGFNVGALEGLKGIKNALTQLPGS